MAEDFYNDSPQPASPPPAADGAAYEPEPEAENEDSNVALLPRSFFPASKEVKPGSVCKVRVQEVQEDQVLVTYEQDESSEPETAADPPPPADMEMAQYMG